MFPLEQDVASQQIADQRHVIVSILACCICRSMQMRVGYSAMEWWELLMECCRTVVGCRVLSCWAMQ